ncbi:MAG: ABC transporter substrate-binding protein [Acidimicrobiia bacterium]
MRATATGKRPWVVSGGLACVLALLGVYAPATGAATTKPSKPTAGGSVTYVRQTEPRNYDAAKMQVGPIAGISAQALYDQLFYEDDSGNPTPGLATSLKVAQNNTIYTIKLRKGVTFTDGTPFDANAVIAHWTRIKDPAVASPGLSDAQEISSMRAVDAQTVEATLAAPDATWRVPLMTGNLTYVPSPAAVAKFGATYGTSPQTTVGAGPYKLQELVFADHQTYVKNTNYWDAPKPYLDSMTFKVVPDLQTRYNTFVSGGGDLIDNLNPGATNVELNKNYHNISPPVAGGGYGVSLNTTKAPTDDPDVRLALAYAINRDALVQRAAVGTIPATTLYDKTVPWYSNLPIPNNNLKKAQSLIDGYLKRTKTDTVTVDIAASEAAAVIMQSAQQDWSKVKGLTVNVTIESLTQNAARIGRRDYPNGLSGGCGGCGTPRGILRGLNSASSTNIPFLNDPQMDAATQTANETANPEQVKAAMTNAAQRFNATMPVLLFYRLSSAVWTQENIKGVAGMPDAVVVFKTQDLYKTKA